MTFMSDVLITLIYVCIGIAVSYFLWNYFDQLFFARKKIILPGPKKLYRNFLRGTPDELLDLTNFLGKHYPSPFQIPLNYTSVIVIYEPNQIKTILQSPHCLDKYDMIKYIKPLLGMGLFTAPVFKWIKSREIIAPSFNSMLQKFFDTFVKQSLILTNELEKVGLNGKDITFHEHVSRCTMDMICGAMGIKMESNKRDQYLTAVRRFFNIFKHRIYSILIMNNFLHCDGIYNLTTLGREQQKILKLLDSLSNEIIQHQQNRLNNLHTTKTDTSDKTVFDILMEAFHKGNFKLIRDLLNTLMISASSKLNSTLDFVVFMLANFPKIQEKVYKELTEIYGTETPMSTPIKYEDLQHMHYLDRVIKETMRLFPPVPIIGRQTTKDVKMDETILPKNSNILILFIRMFRNEEYWPNALKFDPDRFLPERIKDHSYYYIPFSDGPRNCIGIKYAMTSMKVILATLIRTFVFKTNKSIEIEEIKLTMDLTLSTIEPLKVTIEKRSP